jgi:acyl-CoA thioester hydrolase
MPALGLDLPSKRKRTRADYFYHRTYRLRWSDNDVFGHVNNPYYGVLADSIINEYMIKECGYRTSNHPQAAIIANTYFDYFGSLSYPDVVECGLRVVKLGKTSVMYEVGVFKEGDEAVRAVGGSTHIWVEQKPGWLGRPLKEGMPEEMRRGYEKVMGEEARDGAEQARKEADRVKSNL